jgi:hypothetical protein
MKNWKKSKKHEKLEKVKELMHCFTFVSEPVLITTTINTNEQLEQKPQPTVFLLFTLSVILLFTEKCSSLVDGLLCYPLVGFSSKTT